MRILRFGFFGGCYVAPTLYGWLRVASAMWPQTNLRVGALKVSGVVTFLEFSKLRLSSFAKNRE